MFILDPGPKFFHPGSRVKQPQDPRSGRENKVFLISRNCHSSSRKYDPGCLSRIWTFPHPGSRGQRSTGSRIRNTVYNRAELTMVNKVMVAMEQPVNLMEAKTVLNNRVQRVLQLRTFYINLAIFQQFKFYVS
jgi:hypothetical protein